MFQSKKIIAAALAGIIVFMLNTIAVIGAANVSNDPYVFSAAGVDVYCVAQEGDYIYALNKGTGIDSGLYVYDVSNLSDIKDVTNSANSDLKGDFNSNYGTLIMRIYGNFLYAAFETGKEIRIYSLENPANPQLSGKIGNLGNSILSFDISEDYIYIGGYFQLTAVKLSDTSVRYTLPDTGDTKFMHYDDNKLYASRDGEVYIADVTDPSAMVKLGSKAMLYGMGGKQTIQEVYPYNGYLYFTTYSNEWMQRKLYALNISNPSSISSAQMYTYPQSGTLQRISSLYASSNVLYGVDIDAKIHIFDIRNPASIIEFKNDDNQAFSAQAGLNIVAKSGKLTESGYLVAAAFDRGVHIYPVEVAEIKVDTPAAGVQVTTRPITVSGSVFGSSRVNVYYKKQTTSDWVNAPYSVAGVQPDGSYTAVLNDEFLSNGVYSVKAVAVSDFGLIPQSAREAVVNNITVNTAEPLTFSESVLIDGQNSASLSTGELKYSLSIENNSSEIKDAVFITALYKNEKLEKLQTEAKDIISGESGFENILSLDLSDIAGGLQSYLIKKENNNQYKLLWKSPIIGSFNTQASPKENTIVTEGLTLNVDSLHMQNKISVTAVSEKAVNKDILVIMLKPDSTDISGLDNITVITGNENGKAAVELGISEPAQENLDYKILASFKTDSGYLFASSNVKYFGTDTVKPVLEAIKTAESGLEGANTIGKILYDNMHLLSIDMNGEYSILGDTYKNAALEAIRGKDYLTAGVVSLKTDFNNAVAVQKLLESVNSADTPQKLKEGIIENAASIGVSVSEDSIFGKLTQNALLRLYDRMASINYTQISNLKDNILLWSSLEYINQTAYTRLEGVISESGLSVVISLPDRIINSQLAKDDFYREIGRLRDIKFFDTESELQTAINSAVVYILGKYPESSGSAGKSPSSGGGGGSTVSVGKQALTPPAEAIALKPKEGNFNDLASVEWARESIEALYEKEIISGRYTGIFEPDSFVTREEFTKMIVLAFSVEGVNGAVEFLDVADDRWSNEFIKAASAAGIIKGISDMLFEPDKMITRQDMCVILYRAMSHNAYKFSSGDTVSFGDSAEISEYALEAVEALSGESILGGYPDNTFKPFDNATRAMAAKIIYEAISKTPTE